jgi:hypothetical protein
MLMSCGPQLPSHLSQFPADLSKGQLEASGIYEDGWTAQAASAELYEPSGEQVLLVRGSIPQINDPAFRTEVTLLLDNEEVFRQGVGTGNFQVLAPLDRAVGKRKVGVHFSATQELPGGDGRRVGARLSFLGFESASSTGVSASADIVRGTNVELGDGWYPLETFRGERFRWVANDAILHVTPAESGEIGLSLVVEPGPGVAGKCILKALDGSGRQVASAAVRGRQTVTLIVPADGGKNNEFKLHVDGGGRPAKDDPRILNFRVFQVRAAKAQA